MNFRNEKAAPRQSTIPCGWVGDAPQRSNSESRLQAAVVVRRPADEKADPNADVPCTD